MNSMHQRSANAARRHSGLTLVEVMVAVVVLSLGLLGMGALMGVSVRNTQSANFRTQATNLAYEYIDMVRANIINMGYYEIAWTDPATACVAAETPTDYGTCGLPHVCDLARWGRDLCHTLPNGRGRTTIARGVTTRDVNITVDICWSDDRSALTTPTPTAECTDIGETLFTVTSGL